MNDIIKIIQDLEDCNILLKGVTKTIEKESKEQKGRLLSMLLSGKGIVRAGYGCPSKKGKGIVRAGYGHPSFSASQKHWDF